MNANERQVGGTHYKVGEEEEHWDRAWRLGFDPFQYQITKYVERWKLKDGIPDLEKALHFIEKYIELARRDGIKGARQGLELTVNIEGVDAVTEALDAAKKVVEGAEEKIGLYRETAERAFKRLQHVLGTQIVTETGLFEFGDNTRLPCLRGKPSDFTHEGGKSGETEWRCVQCRRTVWCKEGELPWAVHHQPCELERAPHDYMNGDGRGMIEGDGSPHNKPPRGLITSVASAGTLADGEPGASYVNQDPDLHDTPAVRPG